MSHALTDYYRQIIRRQIRTGRFNNEGEVVRHSLRLLDTIDRAAGPAGASFKTMRELEVRLLEGLDSGEATPMTPKRRRRIYEGVRTA